MPVAGAPSAGDRQGRNAPKVLDLLVGYVDAERIIAHVDPLSAAALLFAPCLHRAFVRHGMGRKVLSMTHKEFVADLVARLMQGLLHPERVREPTQRALACFMMIRMIRRGRSLARSCLHGPKGYPRAAAALDGLRTPWIRLAHRANINFSGAASAQDACDRCPVRLQTPNRPGRLSRLKREAHARAARATGSGF